MSSRRDLAVMRKRNRQHASSDMPVFGQKVFSIPSARDANAGQNTGSADVNKSSPKEEKAPNLPSFTMSQNGSITIDIFVGSSPQKFVVYKSFLCHHSPYFQKSLSGQFQEAQTGVVNLDEVDIHAFGLFVDWLYTGQINKSETEAGRGKLSWEEATELWILADYLQIPPLQNHTIDMFLKKNEEHDTSGLFESCIRSWDKTSGSGPLFNLLVDKLSNVEMLGSKAKSFNKAPSDLLGHLFNIFTEATPKQRKKKHDWNASDYYV